MTSALARIPCLVLFRDDAARPASVFGPRLFAPLRLLTSARSSGVRFLDVVFMGTTRFISKGSATSTRPVVEPFCLIWPIVLQQEEEKGGNSEKIAGIYRLARED